MKKRKMYRKIDLHLHTSASDGSDTPAELLRLARNSGISVVSVTDHDTIEGMKEALNSRVEGVKIITGIEFSCKYDADGGFDCHILGYGFDPESKSLLAAIEKGRLMRREKLDLRLVYLREVYGIDFDADEREWLYSLNSAARPHLANLLIKRGLATDIADAMDKYLRADGFPDDRIDASLAIDAILSSGGVPVWAHPLGGEREERLLVDEVRRRAGLLRSLGLRGLECYYSRYSREDISTLLSIADEFEMLVSGGSDYHGRNKTVELGRLCSEDLIKEPNITALDSIGMR